jgi:alcohol dehydrogenase class IV
MGAETVCLVPNNLPGNVLMGKKALEKLEIPEGKILIITDKGIVATGMVEKLVRRFPDSEIFSELSAEPATADLDKALSIARQGTFRTIVGFGGGSVLDTAKAVAALKDTGLSAVDALGNHPEFRRTIFLVAIPTTAGTGSEATLNAIFIDSRDGVKKALVSRACLPDTAVLDPELTVLLPPSITASTGVDALCHCVESLISLKANSISETFSLRGINLIENNLRRAVEEPSNLEVRFNMLNASYWGGAALAIAGTAAVHALAYPLGKRGIPHGIANSMLFLGVMGFNLDSCAERLMLLAQTETSGGDVFKRLGSLVESMPIPNKVQVFSIEPREIETLAVEAMEQTRLLNNNPKPITQDQAAEIYRNLF